MEIQAQLNPDFSPGDNFVEVDLYDASGTNNHAGFIKGLKTANAVGMQDHRTKGLTFVGKIADSNFDINQPINPPTNNNSILRPTAGGTVTAMRNHIISLGLPNQSERFVWLQTNVNFPDFGAVAAARAQGIDVAVGGQSALANYINFLHEMFLLHGAQSGHSNGLTFIRQISTGDNGTSNDPTDDNYIPAGNRSSLGDISGFTQVAVASAPLATSTAITDPTDPTKKHIYYKSPTGSQERVLASDLVQTNGSNNTFDNAVADYAITNRIKNENNPITLAVISHTINTADVTITFSGTDALNDTHRVLVDENGVTIASENDFYEVYFYQNDNTNNDGHLNETGIRFFRSGQAIDYTQFGDGNPANLSYKIVNLNKQTASAPIPLEVATNQPPVPNTTNLPTITEQCEVTNITPPTATDPEDGTITGTTTTVFPITISTTVIWSYDDGEIIVTQNQTVTINDTQAPVPNITNLPNLTAQCEITSLTTPTATDNCQGTITATHNATLPVIVSTTITWSYTDGNNTSSQQQDIIIDDTLAPNVPTNFIISNITSNSADAVSNVSTDNCSTVGYKFYLNAVEVGDTVTPVYQYTSLTADTSYEMYNKAYDVANNLSAKSNSEFITTTLSLDANEVIQFSVYPNPTSSILNVVSNTKITKIVVYNRLGQLVVENTDSNTINISNLSQGVYFVKITDGNGGFGVSKVVRE